MEEYLGIIISLKEAMFYRISQPFLIKRNINSVPVIVNSQIVKSPAWSSTILTTDADGVIRKEHWYYTSVIGMFNYLASCTHPEMLFAFYQCAHFSNDPKYIHKKCVNSIIRHLIGTQKNRDNNPTATQGIIDWPDKTRIIDAFVDISFSGKWNTTWSNEPCFYAANWIHSTVR